MARMTVLNFRSRAALDGAVFAVAVLGFASLSAPLNAQDLRDIPQQPGFPWGGPDDPECPWPEKFVTQIDWPELTVNANIKAKLSF